jgi:phosphate transport system protein
MESELPSTVKRTALDHDISTIKFNLRRIGRSVEEQTESAVFALQQHDLALAARVIQADDHINELRYLIERECLDTIAMQQPTARDLRRIIAAQHMAVELERMADHAAGIADIALRMGAQPLVEPGPDIPRMQVIVCGMVREAIQAFVDPDIELAHAVLAQDQEVDQLYVQTLRVLLTYMMQDSQMIADATYLLWVAHNLERIGDRATNLCERVLFAEGGELGDYRPEQPPTLPTLPA